jgi:carbonic anhydrase
MTTPNDALRKLQEGNARFSLGLRSIDSLPTEARRRALAEDGQKPFAMVLSCADSRVPSEIVFDCGLGELFVVRVAGNIVAPSLIGSLEFAAENFETSLCIVMGHSGCGAVKATVDCVVKNVLPESDNVKKIVQGIAPSVKAVIGSHRDLNQEEFVEKVTEQNVSHSVSELLDQSSVLRARIASGHLAIVGANYCLHTGVVTFFDQGAASDAARTALNEPGRLAALEGISRIPPPMGS